MKKSVRIIIPVFILIIIIGVIYYLNSGKDKPNEIMVLTFGGEFAEAQRQAFFVPFQNLEGIIVKEDSYNGEYGKLKATVETGSVRWNVVDIEAASLIRGIRDNIYAPLDFSIIDTAGFIPRTVNKYGIGTDLYSVSLGYSTKYFKNVSEAPQNWKDFWDISKFPGPRCLKKDPKFTLEIALLADGVPIEQIYSTNGLDVDRAFRSLDKIKPYVKVWWTSGQQAIQLLSDGEVAMAAAFGARVWIAKNKDKRPVDITWNQSITDIEYWAILRGSKNQDISMQFINFATRPEQQAAFSKIFPLGPANNKAFNFLDSLYAKNLNTYPDNFQSQLVLNAEWWAKNEEAITQRWNEWLIK